MARSMVVSIIGRPNVGKSTIFNRLMQNAFSSITHDLPGVTRDRHYGIATLDEIHKEEQRDVILVDTGGFYPEKVKTDEVITKRNNYEPFFNLMADHAKLAIDESDLVLFIVDVREGLLPFDKGICEYIRKSHKKFWLVVNKFDSEKQWGEEAEFYTMGIKENDLYLTSAEHGRGLHDLRVAMQTEAAFFENITTEQMNIQKGVKPNFDVVSNVAIIGAPNVGKSTLLNKVIGAERSLVSDIAGTTVDPIEGYIDLDFGRQTEKLSILDNKFRQNNFKFVDDYRQFLTEMEESEASGMISADDVDDAMDLEEDFEMLEKFEMINEELTGQEENYFSADDIEKAVFDETSLEAEETSLEAEEVEKKVSFSETSGEYNKEATVRSVKIVDTAGIRRNSLVKGYIETQSVYRSLRAITDSQVVIYMVDSTKGILHQDRRLIDIALEKGKSVIIALNKIDLMKEVLKNDKAKKEWLLDLRAQVPWLDYCELINISAKRGSHVQKLLKSVKKTILIRHGKVGTSELNKCISALVDRNPVVVKGGAQSRFKIKYASMIKAAPPTFLMFSNRSQGIPDNYRKYLSKGIRRHFDLVNTPVHLIFRTRSEIAKRMRKSRVDILDK